MVEKAKILSMPLTGMVPTKSWYTMIRDRIGKELMNAHEPLIVQPEVESPMVEPPVVEQPEVVPLSIYKYSTSLRSSFLVVVLLR
jgi:hypothetical protein